MKQLELSEVLRLRNDDNYFVDQIHLEAQKLMQKNSQLWPDLMSALPGAAAILSFKIHNTDNLNPTELRESINNCLERYIVVRRLKDQKT